MSKAFADTYYYLALLNPRDVAHKRALAATDKQNGTLVTTRWVLTEVADAMARIDYRQRFTRLLQAIESDPDTIIIPASDELFLEGVRLFNARTDKSWPLTDCISFLAMEQHELQDALTGDHHYEQAGFRALLKG